MACHIGRAISVASTGMALALLLLVAYATVASNVAAAGITGTPASGLANAVLMSCPAHDGGSLARGQRIRLHHDAYPYQKHGPQTG